MATLADTSLTPLERRVLDRLVELLRKEFGEDLRAVWLYGSRARGEPVREESDVDLIVIARGATWKDELRLGKRIDEAAEAEGASPVFFAVHLYDPDYVAQRRAIRSFFFQEVDRDKVVLFGEP